MQLVLTGGVTGTMTTSAAARYIPIGPPVLATGATQISGLVFVPADMLSTVRAELAYRWWPTDEATLAGSWQSSGIIQAGPGKNFGTMSIGSVNGLMIQLGLKLDDSAGNSGYGRAILEYPVVLVG